MDRNRTEEASSAPPSGGDGGAAEEGGMALDADAVECVICLTDPRVIAVYPCRHMCLCASCAEVLPSQGNKVVYPYPQGPRGTASHSPSFRAHLGLILVPRCVVCSFVCPGQCPICRRAAAMLLWIDNSSKRGAGAAAADDDVDDDDDDDDDDEDDDDDDESEAGARPGAPAGAGMRAGSVDAQSTGSHGRLLQ